MGVDNDHDEPGPARHVGEESPSVGSNKRERRDRSRVVHVMVTTDPLPDTAPHVGDDEDDVIIPRPIAEYLEKANDEDELPPENALVLDGHDEALT